MKKIITFLLTAVLSIGLVGFANDAEAATRVKGYYKPSTGTYITPHYRSTPNKYKLDNWSTKGNYNPYTGKKGTRNIYTR